MSIKLGSLNKIELRDIWQTEDRDFTPWLAEEDNLKILGDVIGLELELEAQEKQVGPFRADILCKNIDDESWVLIENQIEKTDHKHLGQLLTYASGLSAAVIVWISAKFTDEHRSALDWLNKITDDEFSFFGLEVELWSIDGSIAAPKFNVISKPNNWSKSVSQAKKRIGSQANTQTKELQLEYWQELINYFENHGTGLKVQPTALAQHWKNFTIGKTNFRMAALLNTIDNKIAVEISMFDPEYAKEYFRQLFENRDNIEQAIGDDLEWKKLPDKIVSKVILYKKSDPTDKDDWANQHFWLKSKLEIFDKVFREEIKKLQIF